MKKNITLALAAVLAAASLAACGSSSTPEATTAAATTAAATEAATEAAAETTAAAAEASDTIEPLAEPVDIKIGATPSPHAEILEAAKDDLAAAGVNIEIVTYNYYVQPNLATEQGEIQANYFQHQPYLDDFNAENKTSLVSVGKIHYEPFGIYPGTKKSLDEIADGDSIAVPNDTTNEARALLLLQDNGIITLKDGAGINATVNDIAENPHNVKIVELEAAQVARVVDETAFVVLNGNYALAAGFSVGKDALAYEKSDSEAAKTYVNVIAVKEGNEDSAKIKALVDVLKSDDVKKYINDTYDGAVLPYEE